jgi:antitoxin component of MazEF toxin-antitoxin module
MVLAVRLPAAVVEALELREDDEIEVHVVDAREFGVSRKPGPRRAAAAAASFSRTAARRLQGRLRRGECPVISSRRMCYCTSRLMIPLRRTDQKADRRRRNDQRASTERHRHCPSAAGLTCNGGETCGSMPPIRGLSVCCRRKLLQSKPALRERCGLSRCMTATSAGTSEVAMP